MEQIIEIIFKYSNAIFIKLFKQKDHGSSVDKILENEEQRINKNYTVFTILFLVLVFIIYLITG